MDLLFKTASVSAATAPLLFPVWNGSEPFRKAAVVSEAGGVAASAENEACELELRLDAVRREAAEEAAHSLRERYEHESRRAIEVERTAVAHLFTAFAHHRQRYFADMEREIVRLALAIARKVLQREASVDPLMMIGAVRAALSTLTSSEAAVLRVPAGMEEHWKRELRMSGVRVETDPAMDAHELRLESPEGLAELGAYEQLSEIERGIFDLPARRSA